MPQLSHFDEKVGIVFSAAPWGRWTQTVYDVTIEVVLPEGTRAKQVSVTLKSRHISCSVLGKNEFQGELSGPVKQNEMLWSIEDMNTLRIVLNKAEASVKESVWRSLLVDQFEIPKETFSAMKEKLDLERFQYENPQYNFANWKQMKYTQQVAIPMTGDLNGTEEDNAASHGGSDD